MASRFNCSTRLPEFGLIQSSKDSPIYAPSCYVKTRYPSYTLLADRTIFHGIFQHERVRDPGIELHQSVFALQFYIRGLRHSSKSSTSRSSMTWLACPITSVREMLWTATERTYVPLA